MKHSLKQRQYRFAVIYETLSTLSEQLEIILFIGTVVRHVHQPEVVTRKDSEISADYEISLIRWPAAEFSKKVYQQYVLVSKDSKKSANYDSTVS